MASWDHFVPTNVLHLDPTSIILQSTRIEVAAIGVNIPSIRMRPPPSASCVYVYAHAAMDATVLLVPFLGSSRLVSALSGQLGHPA